MNDPTEDISEMLLDNFDQREHRDLYRYIISLQGLGRKVVRQMARISQGNFTVQPISDLIILLLIETVKDIESPEIDLLEPTPRVRFLQKKKYVIASFTDNSVLHIFCLDKQTTLVNGPRKPGVEYKVFEANEKCVFRTAAVA